jgi:pimeloyl-ACP methyl ester carboxylesterase
MRLLGGSLVGSVALLGGMALLTRNRARRAEHEHPPQGQFIDVDGVRLHYIERGEGAPVVLVHGNGAMIDDFAISGVLDRAAERHRVIAFDRPGFGYSGRPRRRIWTPTAQAELLHKALQRLGIERPIVVGHSWGTLVALAMALQHSTAVRGLVLASGYYFPTARADVLLVSPPALPVIGDVMRYTISPLLGRWLAPRIMRKVFAPAPVPSRFVAAFPLDLALRPSQIRASAADTALMIPAAAGLHSRYRELKIPVAIIAGAGDEIVDVRRHAERLHRELPQSELRLVDGAGHMVHHLEPSQIIDAISRIAKLSDATEDTKRHAAE